MISIARRPQVSPLRYPGGKGALYPLLKSLIRLNELSGCTYAEPYAGGAGAGLALLLSGEVGRLHINDLDPLIFAMWSSLVSDPDKFRRRILCTPLTVEEWRKQKDVVRHHTQAEPFDVGFATFYLNRTNRSGILNAGPIGGLNQQGNFKIDARFNRGDLAERVRAIGLYASRILVTKRDGWEIVRDAKTCSDYFVYADPPYFEKAGSLYLNSFRDEDHSRLAIELNSAHRLPWVLTYDDVPEVSDLYALRRSRRIDLYYSAHRVTRATEVLVLGDAVDESDETREYRSAAARPAAQRGHAPQAGEAGA